MSATNVMAERPQPRLKVRLADPGDASAIRRFNQRLRDGGQTYQLPLDPGLPGEARHRPPGHPVFRELMIVEDGEEIRAGMLQYHSTFFIQGEQRPFCWAHLPVSEGLVDSRYGMTIFLLIKEAFARQPLQMCLGVGSTEETWARLLAKLGWSQAKVPFLFYPLRPGRVVRGLTYFRNRRSLRVASRLLAMTGAGALLGQGLSAWSGLRTRNAAYECQQESCFGDWADQLFLSAREAYRGLATRDSTTLNMLYPPEDRRFVRLRVRARGMGDDLGWIVLIHKQMQNNPYFGDLHVGTLVDGLARPEHVHRLLDAGRRYLARQRADLVVANWSHAAWVNASRRLGFLSGPSNFYYFVAPAAKPLLELPCPLETIHLCRGDCDGPGQLLPCLAEEDRSCR